MTSIALVVLHLTLAAASDDNAAALSPPTVSAENQRRADTAPVTADPSATSTAGTNAAAPTAALLPKPSKKDIEVLDEVVDLQEADPAAGWYGGAYPRPLRILALMTGRTVKKGGFEFILDHRASQAIYDDSNGRGAADMWNNFLGLDSTVTVGLGLRYGIIEGLDAGLYRVGGFKFDTYEFDVRFQALNQDEHGIDLLARGGLSWFVVPDHADAAWPFAQLYASRLVANRLLATVGLMYHSNSSASTVRGIKYANEEHKWSFAWAAGLEYRLSGAVALDAEMVSCTAGFCAKRPAFSGGIKFLTNRHTFALVCGNTQFLSADAYITNTITPWSKLTIGFNLTREY
jgi:hypothetical protein